MKRKENGTIRSWDSCRRESTRTISRGCGKILCEVLPLVDIAHECYIGVGSSRPIAASLPGAGLLGEAFQGISNLN